MHRVVSWRTASLLVLLSGVAGFFAVLASTVPFSSDAARRQLIATLGEHVGGEVELQELKLSVFPRLKAEGRGLSIRFQGRRDVPPLISVHRFSAEGGLFRLLRGHIDRVTLEGLDIQIPPDSNPDDSGSSRALDDGDHAQPKPSSETAAVVRGLVVDELESTDARLRIIPKASASEHGAKVWAIHRLRMTSVALDHSMPFEATLTNAVPPGDISTRGTFGPWDRGQPGRTPLAGAFTFEQADLSVFKGISGILSAHGQFGGSLERIDIHGETDTPQFAVTRGGRAVPLHATYHAVVDGTNGNTVLERVDGSFLKTSLVAKGAVIGTPGVPGRSVTLEIVMDRARLEDILGLVIDAREPPMIGALTLTTTFELPPGDQDVVRRLKLDGRFGITGTRFTDARVQRQVNELSHRSRGKTPSEPTERVQSRFEGTFTLDRGVATIPGVAFDVPGAIVRLAGTYALVPETIDFAGTAFIQANVSDTTTGFKRLLLKLADPFFKRDGGGSAIPIKITGTRQDPAFGLDVGRVIHRRPGAPSIRSE